MFTWIPIYIELAEKLVNYHDRQSELFTIINDLKTAGLKPIGTNDKAKHNKQIVLTEIDPFTFFANFNRSRFKSDQRRQILKRLKEKFHLTSDVPEDFDGIPVVPPFAAWFFPYAQEREVDDITSLWTLAKAVVFDPPQKLEAELFLRCLQIKKVGPPKLTMGMFWLNPRNYIALDENNRRLFKKHRINTEVQGLSSYLRIMQEINQKLGGDYPRISRSAWEESGQVSASDGKRYWAGGAWWDGASKVEEFKQGNFWQIGYEKKEKKPAAEKAWDLFNQVKVGDEFAIKGLGGQYDLVIYYIGEVLEKTADGILKLKEIERPLYRGKAPSGADWFPTVVSITSQPMIDLIFYGKTGSNSILQPSTDTNSRLTRNLILCGPPGTGKTYQTIERSVQIIDPAFSGDRAEYKQRFDELLRKKQIAFITFHQSYSYEDFVEGIRPVLDRKSGEARYECRAGVFKQLAVNALFDCIEQVGMGSQKEDGHTDEQKAEIVQRFLATGEGGAYRLKPETQWKRFVLVIDEINRGNISKILGELITLLEADKRLGKGNNENSLMVTLPYSGDRFAVPANLFVLATMNTADKSIALVDLALRRRFAFEEVLVDLGICKALTDKMRAVLRELNLRIALRKDRDHQVGHAYFMNVPDEKSFNETFERQIIPLLQEYFYNDWDGLRYILGENGQPDGSFIRKPAGTDAREIRTKWQWFFDTDTKKLNCLEILCGNYKIT